MWWNAREIRARVSVDGGELARLLCECRDAVLALAALSAADAAVVAALVSSAPASSLLSSVSSPLALPLELLYSLLPRGELSAELKLSALEVLRALGRLLATHWTLFPRSARTA